MTTSDIIYLCNECTVYYEIALENENVQKAIKLNDIEMLKEVLNTEF